MRMCFCNPIPGADIAEAPLQAALRRKEGGHHRVTGRTIQKLHRIKKKYVALFKIVDK